MKPSFFSGLIDFKVIDFIPCVGILMVRYCKNSPNIDRSLNSNPYFSITTDLIYSTKAAIEKFLISEEHWVRKAINPVPAL